MRQSSDVDFSQDIMKIFYSKNLEENKGIIFLLTSNTIGNFENKLGKILMEKYLYELSKFDIIPRTIILMNKAVLLLTENLKTDIYLRKLQERGAEILICEESVKYYKIDEKILLGTLIGMETIIENQVIASKIIKI